MSDLELEPAPELELEPALELELEPAPELELEPAPELELEPAPELELEPAPELELEPAPELELEPAPELELEPAPELELEPEPALDPAPAASSVFTTADVRARAACKGVPVSSGGKNRKSLSIIRLTMRRHPFFKALDLISPSVVSPLAANQCRMSFIDRIGALWAMALMLRIHCGAVKDGKEGGTSGVTILPAARRC